MRTDAVCTRTIDRVKRNGTASELGTRRVLGLTPPAPHSWGPVALAWGDSTTAGVECWGVGIWRQRGSSLDFGGRINVGPSLEQECRLRGVSHHTTCYNGRLRANEQGPTADKKPTSRDNGGQMR